MSSLRRLFSAVAVSACLLTGFPTVTLADGLPGFTLWGGVNRERQLPFRLDFGGRPSSWDRYRLRIPAKKMKLAVAQFSITYPNYYDGQFDPKDVEVRVRGKSLPLQEVKWDRENRVIQIFPQEPVPAGNTVELVLSNVKNPNFGGMFYFNCQIQTPGDVPLMRYIGTWILSINN
jgi:Protein of unknown function (DUF2808)